MATYGTDLTLISDGTTGTVTEFGSPYALGNPAATDTENFIEGSASFTQETKNAVATGASIAYDNGSNITFATDDVLFIWAYFAVGADLYTYANSGHVILVGGSLTAYDAFRVSGSDRTPNPRGGWYNYAVDPTQTPTTAYGGGSTAHRYFGSGVSMLAKINKGNAHAVDAMRYGRGEIYCTGTACTFTGMAAENDDNTTNNNRWGLFSDVGGSYLWKGLMSFGQTATAATFSHTGATIAIDDMVHVYSDFNKIEFNHVDTDVTLNSVTINSLSTASPGDFEMIDNCTVELDSCSFNNMGTFIFLSNGDANRCTWKGCNQITHGGGIFENCTFNGYEGTSNTGYLKYNIAVDPDGYIDGCLFTKGTASTHAIEFGLSSPTTMTLRNITFNGYNATDELTDSTLHILRTSGTVTINLIGCSGNISYETEGADVVLVNNPVTLEITVKDVLTTDEIVGARVLVLPADNTNFPFEDSITITGSGTTATVSHTAHGLATNDNVYITGADQNVYNGAYQITVTSVNAYTYTTSETIVVTTATGTIIATMALINGITDATGKISDSRVYTSNQDITGVVRKSTTYPYYQQSTIADTVSSTAGKSLNVQMIEN